MVFDVSDMREFRYVRMGNDAFYCRCGDIMVVFEMPGDAAIFQDFASRNTGIFADVRSAVQEDLEYEIQNGSKLALFESSAYDGRLGVLLAGSTFSSCGDEDGALRYIADQMSMGWGTNLFALSIYSVFTEL